MKQQRRNEYMAGRPGRRKVLLWVVVAAAVLAVGAFVAAVLLGWIYIPGVTPDRTPQQTPEEILPDTVIHFVAGGDLNVTDKVIDAGRTDSGFDFGDVFLDVMPVLSGADLSVVNFEGNLCGEPYGSQYSSAPQQLIQALRNSGVDVLQTANSRTITGGLLGLRATLDGIRAAGMDALGSFADTEEFERTGGFVIREVQGVKVALVAFTKGMDGRGLPVGSENCVNLLFTDYSSTYQKINETGITKVLRAVAAQKPDVTIAMLHWGSEYNDKISNTQKKICELMQSQGVDAIIGTHPHYVQQMSYNAATGQFISYSLGDFFGDAEHAGTDYSVLLDLEITKDGNTGETKITGFSYTPIYIAHEEGGSRILRIREAMTAYEKGSLGRVSQETYDAMAKALERIEKRITG